MGIGGLHMPISMRLFTTADVENLYPRLRLEDKEETIVLGSNPREALLMGAFDNIFSASCGEAYALVDDDSQEVIAAVGFSSGGHLWALCTKFSKKYTRELYTRTGEIMDFLLQRAKVRGATVIDGCLSNLIHARNKPALKWLQRCGRFKVSTDLEVAANGETFYPFRTLLPHEMSPTACASPS